MSVIRRVAWTFSFLACTASWTISVSATATAASPRTLVVGCSGAAFTSISAAVSVANAGDVVQVCPGTYPEAVTVDRSISINGPSGPLSTAQCDALGPDDPSRQAVITGSVSLAADGASVRGVVVDTAAGTAIGTTDRYSGYRVIDNIVRGTATLGIEAESSGAVETVVDRNCVRSGTDFGQGAIVSENGALRRARITSNTAVGNNEGVTALGPYPHEDILIAHNVVLGDRFGIVMTSSLRSAISDNRIDGRHQCGDPRCDGIGVAGGNQGLVIDGNTVTGVPIGIFFSRVGSDFSDPQSNVAIQVSDNVLRDNNTGITEDASDPAPLVVSSTFGGNTIRDNRFSGLVLAPSNDGNLITGNVSHGNGTYGVRLLGAVGTTVVSNTLTQNGLFDALDLRPADNVWTNNTCLQGNPASLCS